MNWAAKAVFAVVAVLWGSAWIPSSLVLGPVPRLRAGALRFAIGAGFCTLLALAERLRAREPSARKPAAIVGDSLILGLAAVGLPYALTVWAVGKVSPGAVAALFALMPLAAFLMSESRTAAVIPALVIGTCGVVILVAQGLSLSARQLKGAVLIAGAVMLGAFALNYAKRRLRRRDLLASTAVQFAFAAVLAGALSSMVERGRPAIWSRGTSISLLALGVAASGLGLSLMYWLLISMETWQVAALQWSATLVSVAEAAWFLRPRIASGMWVGAGLIIGATIWLLGEGGGANGDVVTPEMTIRTVGGAGASESEVGSRIETGGSGETGGRPTQ